LDDWSKILKDVEKLADEEIKKAEMLTYEAIGDIGRTIGESGGKEVLTCPKCEELIADVCGKLNENSRERCEWALSTISKEGVPMEDVKKASKTLREIGVLDEVWEKVNRTLKELKSQPKGQVSYEGQTAENYCLECLSKHYGAAVRLLEEARDFSMREGKVTPEARRKIRKVIEELAGSEDDLGVESRDKEFNQMLEKIRDKQRELRKWLWSSRLPTVEEDVSKIDEVIGKAKELTGLVYQAAEMHDKKFGR